MTNPALETTIAAYGAGLDAELALLRRLQELATRQLETSAKHDPDLLRSLSDERDRVMAGLLAVEQQIRPLREELGARRSEAAGHAGFAAVVALHRTASQLVTSILGSDRDTLEALRQAEIARRETAHALEAGETTLAAYRRVIAPPPTSAALVDKVG